MEIMEMRGSHLIGRESEFRSFSVFAVICHYGFILPLPGRGMEKILLGCALMSFGDGQDLMFWRNL